MKLHELRPAEKDFDDIDAFDDDDQFDDAEYEEFRNYGDENGDEDDFEFECDGRDNRTGRRRRRRRLWVIPHDEIKTYDGKGYTGAVGYSGFVDGDDEGVLSGTLSFINDGSDVGTYAGVTGQGLSDPTGKYDIVYDTAMLRITEATIFVTPADQTKVYDGSGYTGSVSYSGFVNGEGDSVVDESGLAFSGDGSNVGTYSSVTASGLSATNYNFDYTDTATLTVTAAMLALSLSANDKTYDGTTDATGTVSWIGLISGDTVTVSHVSMAFADKNVGPNKTVTASGLTLAGADAGNYTLGADTITDTADITAVTLALGLTADDKTYDGTTVATGTVVITSGILNGDTVTVTASGHTFSKADPGTWTVTLNSITLSNRNYAVDLISNPVTATATIEYAYDATTSSSYDRDILPANLAYLEYWCEDATSSAFADGHYLRLGTHNSNSSLAIPEVSEGIFFSTGGKYCSKSTKTVYQAIAGGYRRTVQSGGYAKKLQTGNFSVETDEKIKIKAKKSVRIQSDDQTSTSKDTTIEIDAGKNDIYFIQGAYDSKVFKEKKSITEGHKHKTNIGPVIKAFASRGVHTNVSFKLSFKMATMDTSAFVNGNKGLALSAYTKKFSMCPTVNLSFVVIRQKKVFLDEEFCAVKYETRAFRFQQGIASYRKYGANVRKSLSEYSEDQVRGAFKVSDIIL